MNGSHASPLPTLARVGMRWLSAVAIGSLMLAVLLLFIRRAMGALAAPLPLAFLAATLGVALAAGVLLRLGASSITPAIRWGPTILLILLAIVLWIPGTGVGGAILLVGAIVGDATLAISSGSRPRFTPRQFAANVTQQFTRRTTAAGSECVDGQIRTGFSAGQRLEYCHVAFCPPLASIPRVTCEQIDGPSARIKVVQVFSHGVRIEVRLDEVPATQSNVVLELHADADPSHQPRTQTYASHASSGNSKNTAR